MYHRVIPQPPYHCFGLRNGRPAKAKSTGFERGVWRSGPAKPGADIDRVDDRVVAPTGPRQRDGFGASLRNAVRSKKSRQDGKKAVIAWLYTRGGHDPLA